MNNRNKQIDSGSGDNRRTYDCDICMRGFTNPQALGGHRNIHPPSSVGGNYSQGEFLGLDLSLRLGSVNVGNDSHRSLPDAGDSKPDQDDDLDLDLRLGGHHHH
ncbi:hypothetical protein Bca52824_014630 [Brassica carinata]|uniref:C2H2-type domain-containing protein n=1 Tax=Brassica carinata TaxID=52824 RepID=A0A8X8B4Z6_BRACI|nr:hypothetical protein Bca52824_014630 [Brassica carinata]